MCFAVRHHVPPTNGRVQKHQMPPEASISARHTHRGSAKIRNPNLITARRQCSVGPRSHIRARNVAQQCKAIRRARKEIGQSAIGSEFNDLLCMRPPMVWKSQTTAMHTPVTLSRCSIICRCAEFIAAMELRAAMVAAGFLPPRRARSDSRINITRSSAILISICLAVMRV